MNISISSVAQEIGDIIGTSRAYSNRRSRKSKCSSSPNLFARARRKRRWNEKRFLYDRYI